MIKAEYKGVSTNLLQSGSVYEIRTSSVIWKGIPRLRVSFGERFRYCMHYRSLEEFCKYWRVRAVYRE